MMLSIDREEKALILNVGMALVGRELEVQKKVSIEIEDGRITSIASGFRSKGLTFKHGVAMPALVNAHMHVLDYAFQEAGLNLELSELVSEPHGLKHKLISTLNERDMRNAALRLFNKLIRQGVYKAVIFCERLEAISLLRDAAKALGLDVTLLARPKRLNGRLLIGEALDKADGLGLDSPLRYSISELEQMSSECIKRGLLKATHISEIHMTHRQGDVKLAIEHFNSDMAIHGVHLEEDDVYALSLNNVSLVLCPRSNMWFSSGLPPLRYLLKHDVNLLIGTDNAGWINPDMWRELEALFNLSRLQGLHVDPREILKIATVNIHRVKGMKAPNNILEEGLDANFIILNGEEIDLGYSQNIYASIVKRGCPEAVIYRVFSRLVIEEPYDFIGRSSLRGFSANASN